MNETTKAMKRRMREAPRWWSNVLSGYGIDVGCGGDPLRVPGCVHFDREQGDANNLTDYFKPGTFDFIHASHVLEHMHDPRVLWEWMTLLKPRGCAVVLVPSWELYEGMQWPSRFNGDHKSTWSMFLKGSPALIHVYVPDFVRSRTDIAVSVVEPEQLDEGYDYSLPSSVDQSLGEAEPWIEFVMRKV